MPGMEKVGSGIRDKHPGSAKLFKVYLANIAFLMIERSRSGTNGLTDPDIYPGDPKLTNPNPEN